MTNAQATGAGQQATGAGQQATGAGQQATGAGQQATGRARALGSTALRWLNGPDGSATFVVLLASFFLVVPVKLTLDRVRASQGGGTNAGFPNCDLSHKIKPQDTPATVSSLYFGDASFAWAILVATNMKNGAPPFSFVANPASLHPGDRLCIPSQVDAETLRERYDAYWRAGRSAMIAESGAPPRNLVTLSSKQPDTLVTWVRAGNALSRAVAKPPANQLEMSDEIWVTVAPHLREFCRSFVREHAPEPEELTLRLEQRLGLPPGSNNVAFVEFQIVDPDPASPERIFRPCSDSKTSALACSPRSVPTVDLVPSAAAPPVTPAAAGASAASKEEKELSPLERNRWIWFLKKYYSSYGDPSKYQYPWTAEGYTFDWATREDDGDQFVKWGETELVVTSHTKVRVLSSVDTVSFCDPG